MDILNKIFNNKKEYKKIIDKIERDRIKKEYEKFNSIMEIAKDIIYSNIEIKDSNHPIFDYIRLLGKSIAYNSILTGIYNLSDRDEILKGNIYKNTIWEIHRSIPMDIRLSLGTINNKEINILKDTVITFPWNKKRIVDNFLDIGEDRKYGVWEYKNTNVSSVLIAPIGVVLILNGNHSTMVGIIQGGNFKPDRCIDISIMYKYIETNGIRFKNIEDNSLIIESNSVEISALFEIGRLLVKNNISFLN